MDRIILNLLIIGQIVNRKLLKNNIIFYIVGGKQVFTVISDKLSVISDRLTII